MTREVSSRRLPGTLIPKLIAGDISDAQRAELDRALADVFAAVRVDIVAQLDQRAAEAMLGDTSDLAGEIAGTIVQILSSKVCNHRFHEEVVASTRTYPSSYRPKVFAGQVAELRRIFPSLGGCMDKLANRELPPGQKGPEEWFAIPRWEALAPTYGEAVELAIGALAHRRKFSHRIQDRTGPAFLREAGRTQAARKMLIEQQPGQDILAVPAQFGMLHRGASARRARAVMAPNEYGLGVFAVACMLLTHPERLGAGNTLMIDCSGDEYSIRGDGTFDRVPLFDLDLGGVEFSIFYEDRVWNHWGTPSAFLYHLD